MIYISVDIDFSEAEANHTEQELQDIVLTMKKASSTNIDTSKLNDLEKQALGIMDKFRVDLPKMYGVMSGQSKYLSMRRPEGDVLVMPILVDIENYRNFYNTFCRIGNDFSAMAYGQVNYPKIIKKDAYKVYEEQLQLKFAVEGYVNGTLTAKYEIPDSMLFSYIKYIADNIGIKGVGAVFPSLSKYNICSDQTFFSVEEYHCLNTGTIVYSK